jgi:predicted aldo/keto reductase-like oxidoreductase
MKTIILGRSGLPVKPLGIGTEHMNRLSIKELDHLLRYCVERGFDYFDLVTASKTYRPRYGKVLPAVRSRVKIAGHLSDRTRDVANSEILFHQILKDLQVEYLDVLFIQWVDQVEDYQRLVSNGLLDLLAKLRQQGKFGALGISGHNTEVAIPAAESGLFDIIMHPINMASSAIATPMRRGFTGEDDRSRLLSLCRQHDIGLIAMKPFMGGKLLKPGQPYSATPVQCLHYTLSQIGVSMALAGVSSPQQVDALAAYEASTTAERDFSAILQAQNLLDGMRGECVYCNHCLPCPSEIDIALINQMHDEAVQFGISPALHQRYGSATPSAQDCIACGDCEAACPFGVSVIDRMQETIALFA